MKIFQQDNDDIVVEIEELDTMGEYSLKLNTQQ